MLGLGHDGRLPVDAQCLHIVMGNKCSKSRPWTRPWTNGRLGFAAIVELDRHLGQRAPKASASVGDLIARVDCAC